MTSATAYQSLINNNTNPPNSNLICNAWTLSWWSSGFTGATIELQGSDDNATWTTFTGATTVLVGSNPQTSLSGTIKIQATSTNAYIRVNVTSVTGTGTVNFQVFGTSGSISLLNPGGGGGGSTCGTLGGDLSGTCTSATVVGVNGASVPAGAVVIGSNSSRQLIAASTTGTGSSAVLSVAPILSGVIKINDNAVALPGGQTGTILQVGNVDATSTRLELDSFGATAYNSSIRFDGTNAAPTTLQLGDEIGGHNFWGYNGSVIVGPRAAMRCYANQNWTTGANGTYCDIATTPNGAIAEAETVRFENDGGVTLPSTVTGGDKGTGTINAAGLFVNGVAVSTGSVACSGLPALTGDVTSSAGSCATTVVDIGGKAVSLAGPLSTTGAATAILAMPGTGTLTYTMPSVSSTLATLGANTFIGAQSTAANVGLFVGGTQVGDSLFSSTYNGVVNDAMGFKNTASGGRSWYFGDGSGNSQGYFSLYDVTAAARRFNIGPTGGFFIGGTFAIDPGAQNLAVNGSTWLGSSAFTTFGGTPTLLVGSGIATTGVSTIGFVDGAGQASLSSFALVNHAQTGYSFTARGAVGSGVILTDSAGVCWNVVPTVTTGVLTSNSVTCPAVP